MWEFWNLLFLLLRRKLCPCQHFTIVFAPSLLLSQRQPMFLSFVTIPAVSSRCFMAMSLVRFLPKQGLIAGLMTTIWSQYQCICTFWILIKQGLNPDQRPSKEWKQQATLFCFFQTFSVIFFEYISDVGIIEKWFLQGERLNSKLNSFLAKMLQWHFP